LADHKPVIHNLFPVGHRNRQLLDFVQ